MSKRVSDAELVRALRCISTAGGENPCSGCRYRTVDDICGYSCDMDQVGLDAADRLEELTQSIRLKHQLTEVQWETLRAYAECNMRVNATARKMYINRNTVMYRLRIIGQQTLTDPTTFKGLSALLAAKGEGDAR